MKKRIAAIITAASMLPVIIPAAGAASTDNSVRAYEPFLEYEEEQRIRELPYENGRVVFKQRTGGVSLYETGEALSELGLTDIEELELFGSGVELYSDETEKVYSASVSGDVWETVDMLRERGDIVYAEPDYTFYADGSGGDTSFTSQWFADDIGLQKSWDYLSDNWYSEGGNPDTVVAVIDTGVDYTHPDLQGGMWINSGEIPGNGIDDDGNGYIDDIYGCSTVSDKSNHSGDPMDEHGHGTHVAGIIAMTPDNGIGGTGIAYGCRIMALKAGGASGTFSATDIAEAVSYARIMGADVINMSFASYADSMLIRDALEEAFGSCVLVASAGNDYIPAEPALGGQNAYPAAYDWVLGVMAYGKGGEFASFSNFDTIEGEGGEYELAAPGVDIYSTLPGDRYGSWAGTSMAAPVVSASAALLRAKYIDKSIYSSRFIMGQLAGASTGSVTLSDPFYGTLSFSRLNIYESLTTAPDPDLEFNDFYLFDDSSINGVNDGDGYADAGETLDIGILVRNCWGNASDVRVSIDAVGENGIADPYVSIITGTVDYGSVGTFSKDDNGIIYEDGLAVGVSSPFRISLDKNIPNNHAVKLNVTIEARNGSDELDNTVYTSEGELSFTVQNGRSIKGVIQEDMTLTNDYYWIVDNAILIPEGVTVNVEPGTQIQFCQSEPYGVYDDKKDVYIEVEGKLNIEGTCEEPVDIFPSESFPESCVEIRGNAYIKYANIRNPELDVIVCDHLNLVCADSMGCGYYNAPVSAESFTDSTIKNCRNSGIYGMINPKKLYSTDTVQFDNCACELSVQGMKNCVFLDNYALLNGYNDNKLTHTSELNNCGVYMYENMEQKYSGILELDGYKYVVCYYPESMPIVDMKEKLRTYDWQCGFFKYIADKKGGELAVFETEEEYERFCEAAVSWLDSECGSNKIIFGYYIGEDGEKRADSDKEGLYIPEDIRLCDIPSPAPEELKDMNRIYFTMFSFYGMNVDVYQAYTEYKDKYALLKFPDTVPDEVITEFVDPAEFYPSTFENNAFLNAYTFNDPDKWMRITTDLKYGGSLNLKSNYWGTASADMIDKVIYDQNDSVSLARIDYEPYLSSAPESAYPFVSDISVINSNGDSINQAGEENVTVRVCFNRDMDMSVQPSVSFGPDEPYTDFTVRGEWKDPRTWEGEYSVTSSTGQGMQYFRVSGAAAADDPWLVTGTDRRRFGFEVISSSAEALTLQAYGAENRIELSWVQDDFDTLAGYNIYRSGEPDGYYQKLNTSVILPETREYTDTDVEPGVTYYYKFTVVKTDLTESEGSNIASAAALDSSAPIISHTPVTVAEYRKDLEISASVTDNIGVTFAALFYRNAGGQEWNRTDMVYEGAMKYSAVIPAEEVTGSIEYYIEAGDGTSITRAGAPSEPYTIEVEHKPVISGFEPDICGIGGGEAFTVSGAEFEPGASVYIGETEADCSVNEDGSSITGTLPANASGVYDVRVVNPSGGEAVLARALTYVNADSGLVIGSETVYNEEYVTIPVSAVNADSLSALDMDISYDSELLEFVSIEKDSSASGFIIDSYDSGGSIRVSMAASEGASGTVRLFGINFRIKTDAEFESTQISSQSAFINGIECSVTDGAVSMQQLYGISGNVEYYSNGAPVPGTAVSFSDGETALSDESGYFSRSQMLPGSYTLVPSKWDGQAAVSSYDAAMALQKSVGKRELDQYQTIAADVNADGIVNAVDASLILKMAAGKLKGAFPGSGLIWRYVPDKAETELNEDKEISFTAVELGDVSGNWGGANIQSLSEEGGYEYHAPAGAAKISVPLKGIAAAEDMGIIGIDIRLDVSDSGISSVSAVLPESLSSSCTMEQSVSEGVLTVGIMSSSPIVISEDEPLILIDTVLNDGFKGSFGIGIDSVAANEEQILSRSVIEVTEPEVHIESVPAEGERLSVSLPLLETDIDMSRAVLYAAGYDEDNRLLYLFSDDGMDGVFSIDKPVSAGADIVKVFFWSSDSMSPYMNHAALGR